ncbi:MAG TPA: DUF2807 domain-containing protein, partial [Puia sp.]|nr:DUF2807 domain-containing protein [Puia sp.]
NLVLTQDTVQTVSISGDKNLMAGIQTDVSDSTLTIRDRNGCNWLRSPGYEISVFVSENLLRYVTYYGAGNISSTNTLYAPQFTVDSWSGTGAVNIRVNSQDLTAIVRNANASIKVSGSAYNAFIYCADAGSVDLSGLPSTNVSIDQKSVRDSYVNVSGTLQASVVYRGNVYYEGSPTSVDSLITSSGRLIHLQ